MDDVCIFSVLNHYFEGDLFSVPSSLHLSNLTVTLCYTFDEINIIHRRNEVSTTVIWEGRDIQAL